MGTSLYPSIAIHRSPTGYSALWPISAYGRKEIDLRVEFFEFLHGSNLEIPKGRPVILRRMRHDDNGELIACPCVSEKTGEPDRDTVCKYCWGEGFLWNEEWITSYKVLVSSNEGLVRKDKNYNAGNSNIPLAFFYTEYQTEPTRRDRIIEVTLDSDGRVSVPYNREAIFRIATAEAFRSDIGRIEYWRLAVLLDSVRSTWQTGSL